MLGLFNLQESKRQVNKVNIPSGPMAGKINGLSTGASEFKEFLMDFNEYLDVYNESTIKQNYVASMGYFLAASTAFISMYLSMYL